ncbi:hypothetical protein B0H12DRAFT_1232917 [Mycena haematopus]|nr:hypothetical protein B0H12DRAFT_1232917 [Mycena haematopus]
MSQVFGTAALWAKPFILCSSGVPEFCTEHWKLQFEDTRTQKSKCYLGAGSWSVLNQELTPVTVAEDAETGAWLPGPGVPKRDRAV